MTAFSFTASRGDSRLLDCHFWEMFSKLGLPTVLVLVTAAAEKVYFHRTFFFFFSIRVFFTDTDDSQDSRGKEGTIFYSTLQLPPADEHWDIYLHVRWLSRIFNRNACVYQTATRWVFPPYRITIWVIDWWCNIWLFTWWIDTRFLLHRLDIRNRWIWTRINYRLCITSELTNQVC